MKDFVTPLFRCGTNLKDGQAIRGLQLQIAIYCSCRLDRRKRNLQAEIAAKKYFAGFEQRLSFGRFFAKSYRAFQFAAHGSLSDARFFAEFFRQRFEICLHRARLARSEERRVGKECRSRWSP